MRYWCLFLVFHDAGKLPPGASGLISGLVKNLENPVRVVMMLYGDLQHDARVTKEASTLSHGGYEVHVVCLHSTPGEEVKHTSRPEGFQVHSIPRRTAAGGNGLIRRLQAFKASLKILKIARGLKGQIYHAHDANMLLQTWWAARSNDAKLVYDAHEISTRREGYEALSLGVWVIERLLAPRAARMITTTQSRADFFQDQYPLKQKVLVLQNRPQLFKSDPAKKTQRLRETFKIPNSMPVVLYQGGLQSGRGLENFVRLASNVKDAHFVLVGSGRLEGSLKALAKELNLESRVHFLSAVPLAELPAYTASADVGAQIIENTCLNHYTTDSNKLFEYAMAGLPVLASNFPEIQKIVNEHQIGVLVNPANLADIESGLRKLLDNEELRKKFAQNALKAARDLSWEAQESILLNDVYGSIVKGAAR